MYCSLKYIIIITPLKVTESSMAIFPYIHTLCPASYSNNHIVQQDDNSLTKTNRDNMNHEAWYENTLGVSEFMSSNNVQRTERLIVG